MIERERVGWGVREWMVTLVFLTLWLFHWYERVLAPDGGLEAHMAHHGKLLHDKYRDGDGI